MRKAHQRKFTVGEILDSCRAAGILSEPTVGPRPGDIRKAINAPWPAASPWGRAFRPAGPSEVDHGEA